MEISFITAFFETNMYLFLFVIPLLSQLGIPLGAMFFVLFAGSVTNSLNELFILFIIILFGVIIGDILSYFLGKKLFKTNFFQYLLKKKKIKNVYTKTEKILNTKGSLSIFISRFLITGIGPMLNYIAGLQGFNFKKFITYVTLGEILYTAEFLILGYIFRDTIDDILSLISDFGFIIFLLIILYIISVNLFKKK